MKFLVAIGFWLLFFSLETSAQLQQGAIFGAIVGPNGAPIIGRAVVLIDQLGNAVASVVASNGEFRISNLVPGSYSLTAAAPPFRGMVQTLTVVDARPINRP